MKKINFHIIWITIAPFDPKFSYMSVYLFKYIHNNHKLATLNDDTGSVEVSINKGTGFADKWPGNAMLLQVNFYSIFLSAVRI